MERKHYEERPPVIVVDTLMGERYTTVNYGSIEANNGYDSYSLTVINYISLPELLVRLGDTVANMTDDEFRQLSEAMGYTSVEDAKTFALKKIELYDKSGAVNSFYVDGVPLWIDLKRRTSLANSIPKEAAAGREVTHLWDNDIEYILPIPLALQMLDAIELYALDCFCVTAKHKADVSALQGADEVLTYDYTAGYPEQLEFYLS